MKKIRRWQIKKLKMCFVTNKHIRRFMLSIADGEMARGVSELIKSKAKVSSFLKFFLQFRLLCFHQD